MVKLAMIAIITVFTALILRNSRTEYAIITSIAGCILIFYFSVDKLSSIISFLKRITSYISLGSDYISILLKISGITYIAELASDICKDAGYNVIGTQIELAAKLCIMAISIPVLTAIIDTIDSLII